MTRMSRSDWKLIGMGVAIGALAFPAFQLFRILSGPVMVRTTNGEAMIDGDSPTHRGGNIINICVMGMMATTRVNKVIPAVRTQPEIEGQGPITDVVTD